MPNDTSLPVLFKDAVNGDAQAVLLTSDDSINVYSTVEMGYVISNPSKKVTAEVHVGLERKNTDGSWARVETSGALSVTSGGRCHYTFSNIAKTGRTMRVVFNLSGQRFYSIYWTR